MGKIMKSDWERIRDRHIRAIQNAIKILRAMSLTVEIEKDVETMDGRVVDHIYLRSRMGTRLSMQKHLFTADREK